MSCYMGTVTAPTHQVDGRPISSRLWAFVALVLVVCPAPLAPVCSFLASWACWICNVACRQDKPLQLAVQFSESVHEKRNGEVRIASKQHAEGSSCFSLIIPIQKYFHNDMAIWKEVTEATCWYGELFLLTQAQNVHASWPLDVVFAVCSSASFCPRNRRREATQKSVFFAVSSLNSIWCVRGFREHTLITETLFCYLRTMSSLINVDIQATKTHCTLDKNTPNKIWLLSSKGKGILGIHSPFQMTLK